MAHPAFRSLEIQNQFTPGVRLAAGTEQAYDALCRVLNIAVALIGVVLTLPLMAVIAVAVKATSPGPVFYQQPRVGWNRRSREDRSAKDDRVSGRTFTIYKFRTMRNEPAAKRPQVWASKDDPRITRVGRFLRRTRLDELPQLFNVLIGDMNVVGPRPEQPDLFLRLQRQIRDYAERQRVLPGITGLAQVTLAYDASVEDVRRKLALDLEYLRRRSPLEDLRIMLRTPMVMVAGRGAV
jgi:lipopolysaccharide/colanic/teichoic acid biosynthesis glycosyltransferase